MKRNLKIRPKLPSAKRMENSHAHDDLTDAERRGVAIAALWNRLFELDGNSFGFFQVQTDFIVQKIPGGRGGVGQRNEISNMCETSGSEMYLLMKHHSP